MERRRASRFRRDLAGNRTADRERALRRWSRRARHDLADGKRGAEDVRTDLRRRLHRHAEDRWLRRLYLVGADLRDVSWNQLPGALVQSRRVGESTERRLSRRRRRAAPPLGRLELLVRQGDDRED